MKITRERYVAVCDNRTKIMISHRSLIEWRTFDKIGKAQIASWNSRNTAIAALKSRADFTLRYSINGSEKASVYEKYTNKEIEIVKMIETIDLDIDNE